MRKKARLTLLAFSIVLLAGCETFLGLFIPNPAEECTWLEQAAYVAMPIGFMDAPRIMASWYGTEDGHVEWISVQGGYRNGDIRVAIDAMLYGDPAGPKPPDSGWSTEIERQNYLDNADDAQLGQFSNKAYKSAQKGQTDIFPIRSAKRMEIYCTVFML